MHRPAADQRQRGLPGRQVVDRAVQQVSAEPHDIGVGAGGQDPDAVILAEQLAARRGVQPDGGSKKLTLQSLPAAISAPSSTQARTGMTWLARSGPQYRTRLPPREYSSGC